MAEIEIKGSNSYIKNLSTHLKKEHPSTRKRMKVELNGKKRSTKKMIKCDIPCQAAKVTNPNPGF